LVWLNGLTFVSSHFVTSAPSRQQ